VSTGELSLVPRLSCPTCGASIKALPVVAPGRSWVGVLPCPRCRTYAAHVVTAGAAPRAWLLDGTLADGVANSSG
jgi:uncharacterized protein (UPF0212 family)